MLKKYPFFMERIYQIKENIHFPTVEDLVPQKSVISITDSHKSHHCSITSWYIVAVRILNFGTCISFRLNITNSSNPIII